MQGPQLIYNKLVELSGPYFITQSSGFDGAVVSLFDPMIHGSSPANCKIKNG